MILGAIVLKKRLSFFNGDWEQESGLATLMPFDDSDMPTARSSFISPWKLVSFEVKDISFGSTDQPKNTVSISGVLSIGITRNSTVISEPDLKFHKRPGMSALRVDFEGVYLESQENGAERLVCLLGNSTFPFRKVSDGLSDDFMTSYFPVSDDTYNEEPQILPYDQILLVLRYPKTSTLSTQGIHGEMISLNNKEDFSNYFKKVHITSQVVVFTEYQFSSTEELMLETFDQNPLQDAMVEDGVNKFNNSEFCKVMKYFENKAYKVMPNLKLGGQNAFQDRVGPFVLEKEIQLVDRNNENLRLMLQNIICKEGKVSGVLRLYPATIEQSVAARRTGISLRTLSVEGMWNSSTGLLSMVGCLGSKPVKCDSVVSLYFPKSFSIKQRSVISGCIFSLNIAGKSYWPVFFGLEMVPADLYNLGWYGNSYLSYNYSTINLASAFRNRSGEPQWTTYIKKTLLRYPAIEEDKDGVFTSLNNLSDDLQINTFSSSETFVRIEVLSLGPLCRTSDSHMYGNGSVVSTDQPEDFQHDLLNISPSLSIIEVPVKVKERYYRHVRQLHLEGLYDPGVGTMYLIGCRKVDFDHADLERGLDCLIEVKIEHSPATTGWLKNPTAKITIASQRNEDDTYYFSPISLQTFMINGRKHEKNVLTRKIFEGVFQVLLLLVLILLMLSQLKYMKKYPERIPYISLVMLGVKIFGYTLCLICGGEILIKPLESKPYMDQPYDFQSYQVYFQALDYLARFLLLASLVLVAKLYPMVLKARKALRDQGESAPGDKKVLLVSLRFYTLYLLLRNLAVGLSLKLEEDTIEKDVYLKEIMLLMRSDIQDIHTICYLFPQLIAFRIWKAEFTQRKAEFSRSLSKSFIFAFFFVEFLIPFLYDIIRDPMSHAT